MNRQDVLNRLYEIRFSEKELAQKNEIWKVLCKFFFQGYIKDEFSVLDIGVGHGEFINNIQCRHKYALDNNTGVRRFLKPEVNFIESSSNELSCFTDGSLDAVFMSNFSEHLCNKDEMVSVFLETKRILKDNGLLMMMGPNIRYAYKEYWDFFDHYLPLSDRAIVELLLAIGFDVPTIVARFLPYTTKCKIPKNPLLVRAYLRFPILWKVMGRQMFIIARKPHSF